MKLHVKPFSELTVDELWAIYKLRVDVFVVEQACTWAEIDEADRACIHLWFEEEGQLTAYLRIVPPGVLEPEPMLGRVISVRRRSGLGTRLLKEGLREIEERYGRLPVKIFAQTYARPFYEGVGFRQSGPEFLEDGIPHIEMIRPVADEN